MGVATCMAVLAAEDRVGVCGPEQQFLEEVDVLTAPRGGAPFQTSCNMTQRDAYVEVNERVHEWLQWTDGEEGNGVKPGELASWMMARAQCIACLEVITLC